MARRLTGDRTVRSRNSISFSHPTCRESRTNSTYLNPHTRTGSPANVYRTLDPKNVSTRPRRHISSQHLGQLTVYKAVVTIGGRRSAGVRQAFGRRSAGVHSDSEVEVEVEVLLGPPRSSYAAVNEQQWRRFSFIDQLACAAVTTGNVRNASLKPVLPVLDRLWGRLSTFQSINPDCEIPMTPTRGQSSGGNYWVRLLRRSEGGRAKEGQ